MDKLSFKVILNAHKLFLRNMLYCFLYLDVIFNHKHPLNGIYFHTNLESIYWNKNHLLFLGIHCLLCPSWHAYSDSIMSIKMFWEQKCYAHEWPEIIYRGSDNRCKF